MKKLKRMLAVLLTAIMTLAMATTAFAAEAPTNGNLTVTLQNGSLKDQRIYLFKLFNYTQINPVTYTANVNYKGNLKTVLNVETNDDYDLYSAIAALGTVPGTVQKFANDFTKNIITNGTIAGTEDTDYWTADVITETKNYEFKNVDPGYYLVYLGGSLRIQSSLVTVNGNTSVNLKSTTPTPDKTADKTSVNIGDVIKYDVEFTIPDITGYNPDKYVFTLKDTLSDGLDFVKSTTDKTVVNTGNLEVSVQIDAQKAQNMNATVTGREMSLNLKTLVTQNQNENKGKKVKVTYYAQVNKNAETGGTSNSAKLEYSNDPSTGGTGESNPDVVKTPTFDIKVHKYEHGKDKEYLANAIFQLHKDTPKGIIIKMEAESDNGKYTVAKDQDKATVTDLKTAVDQIGNTGANLQIYGLAEGTYYLVETKAPEGFNELNGVVKIVITKNDTPTGYSISAEVQDPEGLGTGIVGTPLNTEGNVVGIVNNRGTILPGTGGMGTVIFTVVGIVLILGVGASFVISRKRKAE